MQRTTADAYDWFIRLHRVLRHIQYMKKSSCEKMTATSQPRCGIFSNPATLPIILLDDEHVDLLFMISLWQACCRWIRPLQAHYICATLHYTWYICIFYQAETKILVKQWREKSRVSHSEHSKQQASKAQRPAFHSQRQKLERASVGERERQRENVFIWLFVSCRIRALQVTGETDCDSEQKHTIKWARKQMLQV